MVDKVNPLQNRREKALDIANKLDAKDGNTDGKIQATIWNEFVEGKGNKIKYSITLENAQNSISTYLARTSATLKQSVDDLYNKWINEVPIKEREEQPPIPVAPPTNEEITEAEELEKKALANNKLLEGNLAGTILANFTLENITPEVLPVMVNENPEIWNILENSFSPAELRQFCDKFLPMPLTERPKLDTAEDCINFLKEYVKNNPAKVITEEQKAERAKLNEEAQIKENIEKDKNKLKIDVTGRINSLEETIKYTTKVANDINNNISKLIEKGTLNNKVGKFIKTSSNNPKAMAYALASDNTNAITLISEMGKSERISLMKNIDQTFTGEDVTAEEIIAKATEIKNKDAEDSEKFKKQKEENQKAMDKTLDIITELKYSNKDSVTVKQFANGYYAIINEQNEGIYLKTDDKGNVINYTSFSAWNKKEVDGKVTESYTPLVKYSNREFSFNTDESNKNDAGYCHYEDNYKYIGESKSDQYGETYFVNIDFDITRYLKELLKENT